MLQKRGGLIVLQLFAWGGGPRPIDERAPVPSEEISRTRSEGRWVLAGLERKWRRCVRTHRMRNKAIHINRNKRISKPWDLNTHRPCETFRTVPVGWYERLARSDGFGGCVSARPRCGVPAIAGDGIDCRGPMRSCLWRWSSGRLNWAPDKRITDASADER